MGKIYVVGIGPGGRADMTERAFKTLQGADVIVGYKAYITLIEGYFAGKELVSSGMRQEVERCREVLAMAKSGKTVALISSGDSGIYGMAGVMLEVAQGSGIAVEIIPGVTALTAAAAILGAPIMHDFVVISLSDCLTPWELIEKRLEAAGMGDFVVCLYNPKSKTRTTYVEQAEKILLKYRTATTPVGIVLKAGREGQQAQITTLNGMAICDIDMFTVLIIGNSNTVTHEGKMITPRGYTVC
ncbi:MAG: precorrin-3B C(17)-methyltransferase [Hyphomonadaceae bacterium]|nr:precorrin-3B C(17)-methyltransferase [Clostridia bacterium]